MSRMYGVKVRSRMINTATEARLLAQYMLWDAHLMWGEALPPACDLGECELAIQTFLNKEAR